MANEGVAIVWDGLREFRDKVDELVKKAELAARQAVTDGGHLIERRAKQKAPVLTGTLRRSIHVDSVTRIGVGRYQSITGPSVIYARFREFGGTIRPRNKPSLAWKNSDGSTTVLPPGRSVTQKGHPYMKPAFDESIDGVRDIYRLAFQKALDL